MHTVGNLEHALELKRYVISHLRSLYDEVNLPEKTLVRKIIYGEGRNTPDNKGHEGQAPEASIDQTQSAL